MPSLEAYMSVPGYLYDPEARTLQKLAENQNVLEIGTFYGKSTVAMAATAKHVTSVDSYGGDDMVHGAEAQATRHYVMGVAGNVTLIQSTFPEYLESTDLDQFDVIFYDGPHTPPIYEKTFLDAVIRKNYKGVVALHDFKPNEVAFAEAVSAMDQFSRDTGRRMWGPEKGCSVVWFEAI